MGAPRAIALRAAAPAIPARAHRAPVIPAPVQAAAPPMTLRAPVRATAAHRAAAAAPATKEGMRGHEEWREWRDTRLRRECAATKGALLWEWPWKILLFVNLSAHFDREPDTRILPLFLFCCVCHLHL